MVLISVVFLLNIEHPVSPGRLLNIILSFIFKVNAQFVRLYKLNNCFGNSDSVDSGRSNAARITGSFSAGIDPGIVYSLQRIRISLNPHRR